MRSLPKAPRAVRQEWRRLSAGAAAPPRFEPTMVEHLPEPARRWVTHAVAPGTPLWRSVVLDMVGEVRLGAWRPFTARQVLSPPDGFIWAATTRVAGLPVVGYDRLTSGTGEMRWRLLRLVPVLTATGEHVTRSAAGRLAGEGIFVPTTFGDATWEPGSHPDTAVATWRVGGQHERVELHVGPEGQLLDVLLQRWGNPNGAPYGRHPFGVTIEAEHTFAGLTIPSAFRAAWWWGSDREEEGEFFRARITSAEYR